jgi:hypothetical protein
MYDECHSNKVATLLVQRASILREDGRCNVTMNGSFPEHQQKGCLVFGPSKAGAALLRNANSKTRPLSRASANYPTIVGRTEQLTTIVVNYSLSQLEQG